LEWPVVLLAKGGDLVGVGGNDDGIELRAGEGGFDDPGEHGSTGNCA
jgi:hypothetical protein